jgi:polygalacturonase
MKNAVDLKDFSSLQEAVDAVPENGTLFVPPGKWACGSAKLKSNMTLFLAKGAELIAPETVEEHVNNTGFCREIGISRCFIGLFNVQNVTIEGEGTLNGNGHVFWPDYDGAPNSVYRDPENGFFSPGVYKSVVPRPSLLIAFKSENIVIRNIRIQESA